MDTILIVAIGIPLLVGIVWLVTRRGSRSPETPSSLLGNRLVLGDVQHPLVEIERFVPTPSQPHEPLPLNDRQRHYLSALLQHAPGLAQNAVTAGSHMYVLRFAPEVTTGLANGSLTLMESAAGGWHAIAVNEKGRIVAPGTLNQPSGLQLVSAATAVWQGLAMITAQHYLTDINQRLVHIEQGINDIKAYLEIQDSATLLGNCKQLKSLCFLLDQPHQQDIEIPAALTSLDTIDRESDRLWEAYYHHMERYATEFTALPLAGIVDPDFDAAAAKVDQFIRATHIALKALYVKGIAAQFRCALPGEHRIAAARLHDVEAGMNKWHTSLNTFVASFQKRITEDAIPTIDLDDIKKRLGLGAIHKDQREQIRANMDKNQREAVQLHDNLTHMIANSFERITQQGADSSQPMTLVVQLDQHNQVVQLSRMVV